MPHIRSVSLGVAAVSILLTAACSSGGGNGTGATGGAAAAASHQGTASVAGATAGSSSSTSSTGSQVRASAISGKQAFPHGLTIIVAAETGGSIDTGARLLQPFLQDALGVPVTVINKKGAGGVPGAEYAYGQKPDSGVVFMSFLPQNTLGQLVQNGKYDMAKFTPIYQLYGQNAPVYIAKKGSKYTDLHSILTSKTPVTTAVYGVGASGSWMGAAFLAEQENAPLKPVAFSGAVAGIDAALGGSVDIAGTTSVEAKQEIDAGRAQAILQFSDGALPLVPSAKSVESETGKSDEVVQEPMGLVGPIDMDPTQAATLQSVVSKIVTDQSYINKAASGGLTVDPAGPAQWGDAIESSLNQIKTAMPLLQKFLAETGGH